MKFKEELIGNRDEWNVWESWVGSQTFEDFMSFKPDQTIKDAVEDYVGQLAEMFPEAIEEFELNKDYIKINLISLLNKNKKE